MADTITPCPHCGSADHLVTTLCEPPSPHHAQTSCRACDRWIRFEPKPWNFPRAAAFVMPFGQYGGETLAEIGTTRRGRNYLRWVEQHVTTGNVALAARTFLAGGTGSALTPEESVPHDDESTSVLIPDASQNAKTPGVTPRSRAGSDREASGNPAPQLPPCLGRKAFDE